MFNSIIVNGISLQSFLICMGVSLVLGILTALLFMYKNEYTQSFAITLAVLPATVALVIMMINGQIGAGVAVAGAFALVRFRSQPGSAREIVSIFLAMTIGLTIGMGYVLCASIFFVVMAAFVILLSFIKFGDASLKERQLKITIPENLEYDHVFDDILDKYAERYELERVKTTNMGTMYELTYIISLKKNIVTKEMIDEIRCRNGNLNIILGKRQTREMM